MRMLDAECFMLDACLIPHGSWLKAHGSCPCPSSGTSGRGLAHAACNLGLSKESETHKRSKSTAHTLACLHTTRSNRAAAVQAPRFRIINNLEEEFIASGNLHKPSKTKGRTQTSIHLCSNTIGIHKNVHLYSSQSRIHGQSSS